MKDSIKGLVKGMVTPGALSLDPSKLMLFIIFDTLWVCETLGDILTSRVSNSHFGKRRGARDMTTFGSHSLPHVTGNIFSWHTI